MYEQGVPLTISTGAINTYCDRYELPVERWIFDECIFAVDDIFIEESFKRMEQAKKAK